MTDKYTKMDDNSSGTSGSFLSERNSGTTSNEIFSLKVQQEIEKIAKGIAQQKINAFIKNDKFKDEIEKVIKDTKDDLDKKIENSKLSIIETLGLFVALFTFVSIDFQVFRSYRNPLAVGGLSLILLGSISFLLIIFDYFILQARAINGNLEDPYKDMTFIASIIMRGRKHPFRILLFISSVSLIACGLFFFRKTPPEELEINKQQIKSEVIESLKDELENQNKKITETNNNNTETIKDTNKNIVELKKCIKNFGFTYKCFE